MSNTFSSHPGDNSAESAPATPQATQQGKIRPSRTLNVRQCRPQGCPPPAPLRCVVTLGTKLMPSGRNLPKRAASFGSVTGLPAPLPSRNTDK